MPDTAWSPAAESHDGGRLAESDVLPVVPPPVARGVSLFLPVRVGVS